MVIPDEFTEEEKVTGKWWRQLVAGAGAGVGKIQLCKQFTYPRRTFIVPTCARFWMRDVEQIDAPFRSVL